MWTRKHLNAYRKQGLIQPVGYAITKAGRSAFFHPRQIKELKKALGVTLDDTTGLLHEKQFREESGFENINRYRKLGLIKPVGQAMSATHLSDFYHPRQIEELKKALGITLDDTTGLLHETKFREESGLTRIEVYRKKGLIKPVGQALSAGGIANFYHPRQINELKHALGITLDDTTGLLTEKQFREESGLTQIANYRKRKLIKPVGYAMVGGKGVAPFYHPRQIKELKKALGITLDDTTGLLNEKQFSKESGVNQIAKYRKQGLIKPVGKAVSSGAGVANFYHPRQIKELKKALGVTLDDTTGLLTENEFRKSGFRKIRQYREQGLIKPVGQAFGRAGIVNFYHPRQIKELKKRLEMTREATAAKKKIHWPPCSQEEMNGRRTSSLVQVSRWKDSKGDCSGCPEDCEVRTAIKLPLSRSAFSPATRGGWTTRPELGDRKSAEVE